MKIVIRKKNNSQNYITTLEIPDMQQHHAEYLRAEINVLLWELMQEGLTPCFARLEKGE
jgi:hypothetical protein